MTTAADRFGTPGFGPENLPYCSFATPDAPARLGVRLGEHLLDLAALAASVPGCPCPDAVDHPTLDALLAAGASAWRPLRAWLQDAVTSERHADAVAAAASPLVGAVLLLPFTVADYVDYYASEQHATNIGRMFRPGQPPLLPNWKHLPVGYHGRAGTVIVSGVEVVRPNGLRPEGDGVPSYGPSRRLDIEAELGFVLGGAAPRGRVSLRQASQEHLFGVVLFNDWTARDLQAFEYVPLGPYLGKSFASSVSPFVVPWDALAAARVQPPTRSVALASYLDDADADPFGLDISVEVVLDGEVVSRPPAKDLYWTAPQMVAHMTVNGASLRPGDFFGSGTISGAERGQRGSFMELSWGGAEPLTLADGTSMTFLTDGQTVTLRGTAAGPGGSTIDFGECTATIRPATPI